MQATLTNWGNCLGIRIPKSFATMLDFKAGTNIKLELKDKKIILSKNLDKKYDLKTLVSQISPENKPEVIEWDNANGREIW